VSATNRFRICAAASLAPSSARLPSARMLHTISACWRLVAEVPYSAALSTVFIFRSDPAQVNDRFRVSHGHDLREAPLRPFGIVVALLLISRVGHLGLGHRCHRDGSE